MSDKQHWGKDGPESCTRASQASLQAPSQILQLLYMKDFTPKARKLLITTKTSEELVNKQDRLHSGASGSAKTGASMQAGHPLSFKTTLPQRPCKTRRTPSGRSSRRLPSEPLVAKANKCVNCACCMMRRARRRASTRLKHARARAC